MRISAFRLKASKGHHESLLLCFQVNPGSKAEKSGLREGDVIATVNEVDTCDVTNAEVKNILKIEEKIEVKVNK
jgi:C-terminal processing protease CtpA/Prc